MLKIADMNTSSDSCIDQNIPSDSDLTMINVWSASRTVSARKMIDPAFLSVAPVDLVDGSVSKLFVVPIIPRTTAPIRMP